MIQHCQSRTSRIGTNCIRSHRNLHRLRNISIGDINDRDLSQARMDTRKQAPTCQRRHVTRHRWKREPPGHLISQAVNDGNLGAIS
jgi:hypothetical protein